MVREEKIDIKTKKQIKQIKEGIGTFPFVILPPQKSVRKRVSPEFVLVCNQFYDKLKKENPILKELKPITMQEITNLLAPLIKERIINSKNIKSNVKKVKKRKKYRYFLELKI